LIAVANAAVKFMLLILRFTAITVT